MQRYIYLIAFAIIACGTLFADSQQLENQLIENIEILHMGDTHTSSDTNNLKSKISSRSGDLFSQTTFDADLKTLAEEYDIIEPEVRLVQNRVHITIKVWPKPMIECINWHGNKRVKSSKLEKELGISASSVYDRQEFNEAFHKIKAYYIRKGFFEAELDYSVQKESSCNTVVIDVHVNEGRAGHIKEICFHNFTKCEQNEILDIMCTKPYNFFLSWFTGSGNYNEDMIQQDQFMILNYLQNHGYADARVEIDVEEIPCKDRIKIHITATKGSPYYIGNITFEGNELYCDEDVQRRFCIREGDLYSSERIQETVRSIMSLYGKCGYIDTYVNYEPKLDVDSNVYHLHFTIEEGEQYRVGLIKVFGNCLTQTKVILHETLLCPGEVFNMDKLQVTERRLQNIGYFDCVNVYAVRSEGLCGLPGNYRDIHIEVEEGNTGHLGAFFGFSTVENMFGGVNLTERNFNISGFKNIWQEGFRALRGGGEYFHITTTIGKKSRSYVLSWTKPYFMDTPWSVGFDLERSSNRYVSDAYDIEANGFTIHGTYIYNQYIKTGVHYRLRDTDINLRRDKDDLSEKQKEEVEKNGLISAAGLSWIYDSTDHPIYPTCGLKSRISGEIAGLGGDEAFLSLGYVNSYYRNLWGYATLKLRGDVKFIQPLGGTDGGSVPLDERFFLGGDYTIRGYRSYKLGPRYTNTNDPRGGISLQMFSAEIVRRYFGKAEAFLFFDAGHLSMDHWDFGDFSYSTGVGARLEIMPNSPPLTIGYGFPINPKNNSEVKKFFLMVGGRF